MTLLEPLWLLMAVPLVFLWRRWTPPGPWRRGLRLLFWATLVLALCRPVLWLSRSVGTVVLLVDRSASMPEDVEARAAEVVRRLEASKRPQDRLAVVSFGDQTVVETPATEAGFGGFRADVGTQHSRLGAALEQALALLPTDHGGRVLVLSDGRHTDGSLDSQATQAGLRRVPVDFRLLERPVTGDVAIARLDVPLEVSPGEGYLLNAWVDMPRPQTVRYVLRRGDVTVASGSRLLPSGRSRLTFRDRAATSGVQAYVLEVQGTQGDGQGAPSADPLPQNNRAQFLVSARGPRPVLHLSMDDGGSAFADLLEAGGLRVQRRRPEELAGRLQDLAGFSAVLLENVSADALGHGTLEHLAAWVKQTGGGLMLTGGRRSYGLGGYYGSPLEDALPVSMEMRQEHRKLPLAIVVALDRSGSMSAPVGASLDKMDLANRATVEVLDLLLPMDEFGVLAVDSEPYVVQRLQPITETSRLRQNILEIDSMGGGIFVYPALDAASRQLLESRASVRHILLFADAADAEEPGEYKALLSRAREAGISVSVVGLGTPADSDADLLRDIARLGGGQSYFTDRPRDLPRIFAQDTFLVSRSAFLEETTAVRWTAGFELLSGRALPSPPAVGGYNLTYARPEAQVAGLTVDDYEAPWIATWTHGLGRVVALTSEVDGAFSGPLGEWPQNGQMLTALVRWAAGSHDSVADAVLTQRLEGGQLTLQAHLDPDAASTWGDTSRWRALHGEGSRAPRVEEGELRWRDPFTLEAVVDMAADDVTLATVDLAGRGSQALPPVRLPYAPEFRPQDQGTGRRNLQRLADATGGRQRLDVGGIWRTFPRQRRQIEITPWLLLLGGMLLLLEVLERRTAVLSTWWAGRGLADRRGVTRWEEDAGAGGSAATRPLKPSHAQSVELAVDPADPAVEETEPTTTKPPQEAPASGEGLSSALSRARNRARGRLD